MIVDCLVSPGFFGCNCTITPTSIEVGLFVRKELLREDAIADLYDPYEQVNYCAIIPPTKNHVSCNLVLARYASI